MANTTTITGSLPFTWPLPYTFPVTRILSESCTHVNKVGLVVGRANHDGQLHLHIHHIKRLTACIFCEPKSQSPFKATSQDT